MEFTTIKCLKELTWIGTEIEIINEIEVFLKQTCLIDVSSSILSSRLYTEYSLWCAQNNHHAVTQTRFSLLLKKYGAIKQHRRDGNHWLGLTLKTAGVIEEA